MPISNPSEIQVAIPIARTRLQGTLTTPKNASGLVIFAHGSGSSRFSPRNIAVAQMLRDAGCATFLFDLLDTNEAQDRRNVFDITLLADRMRAATERVRQLDEIAGMAIGYFGASTGAAAALVAAAHAGGSIAAVVSRGGRPDLAGPALRLVQSPTLLIVGSLDVDVLQMNQTAQMQMKCENDLAVVEGASHLFEEPGTLEQVAALASAWFVRHF